MPGIIEGPPEPNAKPAALARRLAWFAALAIGAGLTTALIAAALEALLPSH